MADSLAELLEAMLAGDLPPAREAECTSCMGTAKVVFTQTPEDPRRVRGDARCVHCHEEGESEERPLAEPVRRHILKSEGTWTLRIRSRAAKTREAAREEIQAAGLTSAGEPPVLEGTHTEMHFLAARLRGRKIAIALARREE